MVRSGVRARFARSGGGAREARAILALCSRRPWQGATSLRTALALPITSGRTAERASRALRMSIAREAPTAWNALLSRVRWRGARLRRTASASVGTRGLRAVLALFVLRTRIARVGA
ncbi:hypothetical protein T484DRAFT_1954786 [Baffinella frigidus]|nr:hypothetical protein T484DRAFT_1954786 [Cryptophyta sp. CCMP2293]